jgi:hypothetical protein
MARQEHIILPLLVTERTRRELVPCRQCKQCFIPRGNRTKFCGDACRQTAYRERHKERYYDVCSFCSKEYEVARTGQKFCSKACKQAAYRSRNGETPVR